MNKLLLTLLTLTTILAAQPARGNFLPDLTGSSAFNTAGATGFVNYAVYGNTSGGNWITAFGLTGAVNTGTGSAMPTVTGLETNVFFYQITRTDSDSGGLNATNSFRVPPGFNDWVTGGVIDGYVFNDGVPILGGDNSAKPNLGAGSSPTFVPTVPTTPTIGNIGISGGEAVAANMGIVGGNTAANTQSSVFFFISDATFISPYSPGQTGFDELAFASSAGDIIASVPVPNPEPGSLALLAGGMFCIGLTRRRRSRKAKISV